MRWLLPIVLAGVFSCSDTNSRSEDSGAADLEETPGVAIYKTKKANKNSLTLEYEGREINVAILPSKGENESLGSIVLLHGWNLPALEWCEKTKLCDELTSSGYDVIIPDHGKSTYQFENYPETVEKYRGYPTRQWMYQVELDSLKARGLLEEAKFNAVIGLSTGGRGAALFALENPDLFDACVALSADFDQTKLPTDEPINTGVYGRYSDFPDRWEGKDNIFKRVSEFNVPVLIGHGNADVICKPFHSEEFYAQLEIEHPELKKSLVIRKDGKHDYLFWGSMTADIMAFLNEVRSVEK